MGKKKKRSRSREDNKGDLEMQKVTARDKGSRGGVKSAPSANLQPGLATPDLAKLRSLEQRIRALERRSESVQFMPLDESRGILTPPSPNTQHRMPLITEGYGTKEK